MTLRATLALLVATACLPTACGFTPAVTSKLARSRAFTGKSQSQKAEATAEAEAPEEAPAVVGSIDSLEGIAVQYQSSAERGLALSPLANVELTNEVFSVTVRKEGGLGLILAEMWAAGGGPGVVEASTREKRGLVLIEEVSEVLSLHTHALSNHSLICHPHTIHSSRT